MQNAEENSSNCKEKRTDAEETLRGEEAAKEWNHCLGVQSYYLHSTGVCYAQLWGVSVFSQPQGGHSVLHTWAMTKANPHLRSQAWVRQLN